MAEFNDDSPVTSVENLFAEKQALAAKEKKMIDDLNTALSKMGYRIVPAKAAANGANGTGKRLGRPPGSGKEQPPKAAAAR